MEDGWKMVSYFDKRSRAEMFISLLESMKIQAVSINKKGSELLLGSVEVYVREDNLEDAKECLKTFEN